MDGAHLPGKSEIRRFYAHYCHWQCPAASPYAWTGGVRGIMLLLSSLLKNSDALFVSMTTQKSILGKIYTDDPHILALVYLGLPAMGLCEVADAPQREMAGMLTGAACPQQSARIKLCSFYCVGIPVVILLAFKLGIVLRGILLGLLAFQISCAVLMGNALIKMDWKLQAKRTQELNSRLFS